MPSTQSKKRKLKKIERERLSENRLSSDLVDALVSRDRLEPSLPPVNLEVNCRPKEISRLMIAVTSRAILQNLKSMANSKQLDSLFDKLDRVESKTEDITLAQLEIMERYLVKLNAAKRMSIPLEERLHNAMGLFNQNFYRSLHKAVTQLLNEVLRESIGDYMSSIDLERALGARRIIDLYRFKGRPRGKSNFTKSEFEKKLEAAIQTVRIEDKKLTQENLANAFKTKIDARQLRRYLKQFAIDWHDIKYASQNRQ